MLTQKLINKWYAAIVFSGIFALFIEIILLGNEIEPAIANLMLLGKNISEIVFN